MEMEKNIKTKTNIKTNRKTQMVTSIINKTKMEMDKKENEDK